MAIRAGQCRLVAGPGGLRPMGLLYLRAVRIQGPHLAILPIGAKRNRRKIRVKAVLACTCATYFPGQRLPCGHGPRRGRLRSGLVSLRAVQHSRCGAGATSETLAWVERT